MGEPLHHDRLSLSLILSLPLAACGGSAAQSEPPDLYMAREVVTVITIDYGGPSDPGVVEARDKADDAVEVLDASVDTGPERTWCSDPSVCPADLPVCSYFKGYCVECVGPGDCGDKGFCIENACRPLGCYAGAMNCLGNTARVCPADGSAYIETPCGEQVCVDGECLPCTPNKVDCSGVDVARRCRPDGSGWETMHCGDLKCVNGLCKFCVPGFRKCEGHQVWQCTEDGSAYMPAHDCDPSNTGSVCHLGLCINLCDVNAKFHTNFGCEYWAVDLDQSQEKEGMNAQYAIVVSNVNEGANATVQVEKPDGTVVATISAPPKVATIINLPPFNVVGPQKAKLAYRVSSNLPIVAYQFNPLENVGVYSNDASLLLPTNVLGRKYLVMSWPHRPTGASGQPLASTFTVVGAEPGVTTVKIRPSAATLAGGGLPALAAGQEWETTIEPYEVLNFESAAAWTDLTGSYVEADKRVAVFGGHVCANAPLSDCFEGKCRYDTMACGSNGDCPVVGACDHLEEQIQPMGAWGQTYVVGKTWPRGKAPDFVRVLAAEDGTTVTVSPAVATIPVLAAGQWADFEVMDSVVITADKPVLVGHYLEGQNAPYAAHQFCEDTLFGSKCGGNLFGESCNEDADCSPDDANIGDPAFMVGVPVEQFRREYVFLVPTKYAQNYVNVIAPAGAGLLLDQVPMSSATWVPIAGGAWVMARFPLAAGSHSLKSDEKIGVLVYGWDQYVSYGYPGGMNIETLKVYQ